jgi:hypothetical protein
MLPTYKFSALLATTAPPRVPQASFQLLSILFAQLVITALPVHLIPFSARPVTTLSLRVRPNSLIVISVHLVSRALEVPAYPTQMSQQAV